MEPSKASGFWLFKIWEILTGLLGVGGGSMVVSVDQTTPGTTNRVDIGVITMPTALVYGQKTVAVAGTEEALGSSTPLKSGVRIKAFSDNTGWIYVGGNPVTSVTGFILDAGEEVFVEIADLATIYIDVSVNGEGVSYIGS